MFNVGGYINAVSGSHCQIALVDDDFYIMDLSSTNGTFVNGTRTN